MVKRKPKAGTRVLNIRDVPADLLWKAREAAVQQRIPLREFVLNAIQRALDDVHRGMGIKRQKEQS